MTLIATVISNDGIIQASDSNLTGPSGATGTGPKVFDLGFADGALALAGAYAVGTERMDKWMANHIAAYSASASPTLGGFASHLATELESSTTPGSARIFHIAGYVNDANGAHPEFYFVRNIYGINAKTGEYEDVRPTYQVTEDFWTRDHSGATPGTFGSAGVQRYFNGFAPGRRAYLGAVRKLHEFYEQVWGEPGWQFIRPASLDELAAFVRHELETVNTLFASCDYPAPFIGGDVQILKIPSPSGAVRL